MRRLGQLAKSTPSATSRERYRDWSFCFYGESCAHLDPAAEPTGEMIEEPTLGHGKAWMSLKDFD